MTGPIHTPVISRLGAGAAGFLGAAGVPARCCAYAGTAIVAAMIKAQRLVKHLFMSGLLLPERFAIVQGLAVGFRDAEQTSELGAVLRGIDINLDDIAGYQRVPVPADAAHR